MRKKIIILLSAAVMMAILLPSKGFADVIEDYKSAVKSFEDLSGNATLKGDRDEWLKVIKKFDDIADKYPNSAYAPEALFAKGRIYEQLYKEMMKSGDLSELLNSYEELIQGYPGHNLADDAMAKQARIYSDELRDRKKAASLYKGVITEYPDGHMAQKAREELNNLSFQEGNEPAKSDSKTGLAANRIKDIKHWSNNIYTRVVIEMDRQVPFRTYFSLSENAMEGKDIDIDLANSEKDQAVKDSIISEKGILSGIKTTQKSRNSIKVCLTFRESVSYKAFVMDNPARIVLDINSSVIMPGGGNDSQAIDKGGEIAEGPAKKMSIYQKSKVKEGLPSIAKQLSLKVSRIVIDPGHGDHDNGGRGAKGEKEKDVVIKIGMQLAAKLREKGFEVLMTRQDDTFIPLPDRTAFANSKKADLFISIHANANNSRSLAGLETYFLNLTTDSESIATASRENETSEKSIADMQYVINDIMLTSRITESSAFASDVQKAILKSLHGGGYATADQGVKHAPFYVLIGTRMPSILIETGYMTNAAECRLLFDKKYQELIVNGIVEGINIYVASITPRADNSTE